MYSIRKMTLARSAQGTFFRVCFWSVYHPTGRCSAFNPAMQSVKYYMSFEDLYIVIVIFFPCETRYPIRHMQCYYEE